MVRDAEQHAAEDQSGVNLSRHANTAEQVVYQTEETLTNLNGQVSAENRAMIERKLQDLKEVAQQDDVSRIRSLTDEVQQAAMTLGQAAYQQQPDGAQTDSTGHVNGDDEEHRRRRI